MSGASGPCLCSILGREFVGSLPDSVAPPLGQGVRARPMVKGLHLQESVTDRALAVPTGVQEEVRDTGLPLAEGQPLQGPTLCLWHAGSKEPVDLCARGHLHLTRIVGDAKLEAIVLRAPAIPREGGSAEARAEAVKDPAPGSDGFTNERLTSWAG